MIKSHKWTFKARFRTNAYGWKGTALASKRLKEAVSEITKAAKKEPVLAAEGAVSLMERLWPALQQIDTSSGSLGNAVHRTLVALIPILVDAPADIKVRTKWLDRLYEAVLEDGVEYLSPVGDQWGAICGFTELVNKWADFLLPMVRHAWSDSEPASWVKGAAICLSCLVKAGRLDELQELIRSRSYRFWYFDKFWAEALARQGRTDDAIEFAETCYEQQLNVDAHAIFQFCERVLLEAGRPDDAYRRYASAAAEGTTHLARYREIVKKYPDRGARQVLVDLVETSRRPGKWFAAAKSAGFLDIALKCARDQHAEPATLIRAARDFTASDAEFAAQVAVCALENLIAGAGYEPTPRDVMDAYHHLVNAATQAGMMPWAHAEVERILSKGASGTGEFLRSTLRHEHRRPESG